MTGLLGAAVGTRRRHGTAAGRRCADCRWRVRNRRLVLPRLDTPPAQSAHSDFVVRCLRLRRVPTGTFSYSASNAKLGTRNSADWDTPSSLWVIQLAAPAISTRAAIRRSLTAPRGVSTRRTVVLTIARDVSGSPWIIHYPHVVQPEYMDRRVPATAGWNSMPVAEAETIQPDANSSSDGALSRYADKLWLMTDLRILALRRRSNANQTGGNRAATVQDEPAANSSLASAVRTGQVNAGYAVGQHGLS